MSAMDMPFQPADPTILKSLHPGDAVEGTLRVVKEDGEVKEYQLLDLKVTKARQRPPARCHRHFKEENFFFVNNHGGWNWAIRTEDFTMTGQDGEIRSKTFRFCATEWLF